MDDSNSPHSGGSYILPKGDGDQAWFGECIRLTLTATEWFPGWVPDFGEALLFRIDAGRHSGAYLAISGRGESVSASLKMAGYSGVVVFRITNPDSSYDGTRDLEGLGSSVLYKSEYYRQFG